MCITYNTGRHKKVRKVTTSFTSIIRAHEDNRELIVSDAHEVSFFMVGSLYAHLLL